MVPRGTSAVIWAVTGCQVLEDKMAINRQVGQSGVLHIQCICSVGRSQANETSQSLFTNKVIYVFPEESNPQQQLHTNNLLCAHGNFVWIVDERTRGASFASPCRTEALSTILTQTDGHSHTKLVIEHAEFLWTELGNFLVCSSRNRQTTSN